MIQLIDYRFWGGDLLNASSLFNCGNIEINRYLIKRLNDKNTEKTERLLLIADTSRIYGFISLGLDELSTSFFKERNYTVLVVNAIGIDLNYQNRGYGTQLLLTAFQMALTIHQSVPIGGLYLVALVDAFDFYRKFDLMNLNAPPEMVPGQEEFQMVINIEQIQSFGLQAYSDPLHLSHT
ncbi:GNAT family N-acetyltransferase [Streptococcus suis]|uniref:GNAT family N-acetyltransferase n=1 Tax=Streptococcus suis TaxID=1307 RepID=UPI001C968E2C|nr:GNAT family N-acetyltransferase [Streptococcus suis]MBY5025765.1 GNAT family N-acetyltransferase [Streptococcus suis]QZT17873.1 GNAT family N-acetyltransferase [Streptococcus suis]HEM3683592.1 GNAT family N-acetyltransferase [Streptococcus suis]